MMMMMITTITITITKALGAVVFNKYGDDVYKATTRLFTTLRKASTP